MKRGVHFNRFLSSPSINGMRIVECEEMRDVVGEDWSKVRSPGRARRRRRKHRQNIQPLYKPQEKFLVMETEGVIFCHPAMAARLIAAAEETL